MDKGTRVKIIAGKGKDTVGTVFWTGENKWGPGLRLGVRGDDGETYWVADTDAERTDAPAPPPPTDPGPTFAKGDRVRFTQRGQEGTGTVFWIGESKRGPGQRLGVRNDDGEDAVWLDAREAEPLSEDTPTGMPQGSRPAPIDHDDDPAADIPYTPSLSLDDAPPAAPWDDAVVESYAAQADEEDDAPPVDW